MDMKTKHIIILSAMLLLAAACGKNTDAPDIANRVLSFSPAIEPENEAKTDTRTVGFEFFTEGAEIDVFITESNGNPEQIFTYTYDGQVFRGDPSYYFPLDDTYIKQLRAVWPKDDVRQEEYPTDQSEAKDFRLADWMVAEPSHAIMPAAIPVLLNFKRQNSKLEFELVGQNALGLDILELTVELLADGTETAFKAYCDLSTGRAQVIAKAGTHLKANAGDMIGVLKVTGDIFYTMIFPEDTDLEMAAGTRYLVTLEPQGFSMAAYVTIGTFDREGENGIGIPFQKPTAGDNGAYRVGTPAQLVTMSYLMRHYTNGTTVDWPGQTYIISSDIGSAMTGELAGHYVPIPDGLLTGKIISETGGDVTVINYDVDKELFIYEQ